MQPDITRLSLGTGDVQPATMSSVYNGGATARSSQYTPRQMVVRDITKAFSDASAGMLDFFAQIKIPVFRYSHVTNNLFSLCVWRVMYSFADFAWLELRQGQLVKDDFFTLFEAVGALEVNSKISKLLWFFANDPVRSWILKWTVDC